MKRCETKSLRNCAGFSLPEAIIAGALLVMLVQAVASSALYASRSSSAGTWKTNAQMQTQRVANKFSNELRLSSTTPDPISGFPQYTIQGPAGDRVISFQRVVEFGNSGIELVPLWSTSIEYRIEGGNLVRQQDGETQIMMMSVDWLEISVDELGRFHLELGTSRVLSTTQTEVVRTERVISPMF